MPPSSWPKDYRVSMAVFVAAALALGWAEARMHSVAAQEVEPTRADVVSLKAQNRITQQKLDALCRAVDAHCPLGVE